MTEYCKTSHILFPHTQLKKKNVVSFEIYIKIAMGEVKNRFDCKIGLYRVFPSFASPDAVSVCISKLTTFFFLSWA